MEKYAVADPKLGREFWSKFSVVISVLPFFGKKKEWKWLLTQLCKRTWRMWNNETTAFDELYQLTSWLDNREEVEAVFQQIYGKKMVINEDTSQFIQCSEPKDLMFLRKSTGHRFPCHM